LETPIRQGGEAIPAGESCNYVAIIGDIRRSRHLGDRREAQRTMELALDGVNKARQDEVASSFVITLGDEFQGLLKRAAAIMGILNALEARLDGIPMRYGVGWGTLSTELRDQALGMDGPCFHKAREAVWESKQDNRWVTVSGFGRDDDVLNGQLTLIGTVRDRWTDRQAETVALVRQARTQKEAANALGVARSTVSEALTAAMYGSVVAAESAVSAILGRHDERG
jgi:hypothetical protein